MGLFDKFQRTPKEEKNQHGKKFSCDTVCYAGQVFIQDHENPALQHLKNEYSYDIDPFSALTDLFIKCAKVNAEIFSVETSSKQNDHLVHFFFDLYMALDSKLISEDNEIASIAIDAMHIKYFGPPSHHIISSSLQLEASQQNEKCFLASIFSILNGSDFPRMLAVFAHSCISKDNLKATEGLYLAKLILEMVKHFQPTNRKTIRECLS